MGFALLETFLGVSAIFLSQKVLKILVVSSRESYFLLKNFGTSFILVNYEFDCRLNLSCFILCYTSIYTKYSIMMYLQIFLLMENRLGPMAAMFKYSPFTTYTVSVPPQKIQFSSSIRQDWLTKETKDVNIFSDNASLFILSLPCIHFS